MSTPPFVIGIAGASGSGKTYLARFLAKELGLDQVALLSTDCYYRDLSDLPYEERRKQNFDEPDALDNELFIEQFTALIRGNRIEKPVYDFARSTRAAARAMIEPRPYIILEGLYSLYWPEIREQLHTRVFLELDEEMLLRRRMERDFMERGRDPEFIKDQFYSSVLPMFERHVHPTVKYANVILNSRDEIEIKAAAVLSQIMTQQCLLNSGEPLLTP